jgi:2-(1,2-epoxy-1,2-dihydrophenyl)acetyl-CoA isomerase
MTNEVSVQCENGIAVVTMNRPEKLNALTTAGFIELTHTLRELALDNGVAVVIVTGAGRAFCAGGDVSSMAADTEFSESKLEGRAQALREAMDCARVLHDMPKPTIAMVRGAAAGAGLSIALSCDLRVASANARLVTAFKEVAYSGDFGGSYFLTKLVGPSKAKELYFLSEQLNAEQALKLGMVNLVVADSDLDVETRTIAGRLAAGPQIAYRYMKRNLNAAETLTLMEVMDLEAWHHTRCGMTEDHREGARAFVEKRKAQFKGR